MLSLNPTEKPQGRDKTKKEQIFKEPQFNLFT